MFALHGVVPRLAIRLHASFSEKCLYHDLHVFSRSSRNTCSSRSMAVGGARPYRTLHRFDRVLRERAVVFSGDTMFSVILLMSALYVLSSLQNRTSSQIWFGTRRSSRAQRVDRPCAVRACPLCCPFHTTDGPRVCPRPSCRPPPAYVCVCFCTVSASGHDALIWRVSPHQKSRIV